MGPGKILKVNSPVSYRVQTDERTIPTVNVQQLKLAKTNRVNKITTVLEDPEGDQLADTLAGANIQTQTLSEAQELQLRGFRQV